jgi:hypothetical protein
MSRLNPSEPSAPEPASEIELDPIFKNQIDNLYRLNVYGRWAVISLMWLTIGAYSLWELRYPISLIQEDFTWAAVKYGLVFEPIPALGLCLCVGLMTGTLVWQSRNIIWGIPKKERQRLTQQVANIRKQGNSHPLWKFVVKSVNSG